MVKVKQDEYTPEQYEDLKEVARKNVCGDCGGYLSIHTTEDGYLEVWCPYNSLLEDGEEPHRGFVEMETYTQASRRGMILHPSIQKNIDRHLMPKDDLGRALNLLAVRYPDAIKDVATASLFLVECKRLGLEPLITPAEAVPVAFKSKLKDDQDRVIGEKHIIQMIITEDGWLSMAARGCPEDYVGPPKTMPLLDYLLSLPEHRDRPLEQVEDIKKRRAAELSNGDREAWCWVAIGARRGATDPQPIHGWYTKVEHNKAVANKLPAGANPGNQARVRAIKRWVRETFPECRQRMLDLMSDWMQRAEGIHQAQEFIDAEYSVLLDDEAEQKKAEAKARGEKAGAAAPKVKAQAKKSDAPPPAAEEKSPDEPIEGESFTIDPTWLDQTLKEIKWSEETAKSWISVNLGVAAEGKLTEVLSRLTRGQAEEFVKEIQERAAKKQSSLF